MINWISNVIGSTVIGLSKSVGGRLASRYVNTLNEQLHRERLEVQKLRIQNNRAQHEEKMAFERQRHLEEITARFDLQTHQNRLNNWPLTVSAADVITRSGANQHQALNLFLLVKEQDTPLHDENTSDVLNNIYQWMSAYYAENYSTHPAITYINPIEPSTPSGEVLVSTMYGMLKYEPTLVIECQKLKNGSVSLLPHLWGIAGEYDYPPYKLGAMNIDMLPAINEAWSPIALSLRVYIASIVDMFFLTMQPDKPIPPIMHQSILQDLVQKIESPYEKNSDITKLLPPIYTMYNGIAPKVGLDLSETFIKALYESGSQDLAKLCFLNLCRQITQCTGLGSKVSTSDFTHIKSIQHFSVPTLQRLCEVLGINKKQTKPRRLPMQERGFST